MRTRVKICGIRDEQALEVAVEAGADAVGFVVAFPRSPRCLDARAAADLLARVPAMVSGVAVSRHPAAAEIRQLCGLVTPQWLQTDAEDFLQLGLPQGCRPLRVVRGAVPGSLEDLPGGYRHGECLLFEGAHSGRGEVADWDAAAELARRVPLVLAGGLGPGNVGSAIARVRPYGVDVSSGVESAPGVKDPDKIHAFMAAVRAAEKELEE